MGIDSHMIHTAEIQRGTTIKDSYNAERITWVTHLTDVRGRLIIKTQRVGDSAFAERPIVTTYRYLTSPGVDIRQGDRIVNIRDAAGAVDAGPFRVDEIMTRRARAVRHISLLLEKLG